MADQSIKQRIAGMSTNPDKRELKPLFDAILTDLTELKSTTDDNVTILNALTSITSGAGVTAAGSLTLTS